MTELERILKEVKEGMKSGELTYYDLKDIIQNVSELLEVKNELQAKLHGL